MENLTTREVEIVNALVTTGLSNKGLARHLGIAEGTVKIHLHKIYIKLGVPGRTALVLLFAGVLERKDAEAA